VPDILCDKHGSEINPLIVGINGDNISFPGAANIFYKECRKLRFEIDLEKINNLNVALSSELLKLARIKLPNRHILT
jgi:hypothetical protein